MARVLAKNSPKSDPSSALSNHMWHVSQEENRALNESEQIALAEVREQQRAIAQLRADERETRQEMAKAQDELKALQSSVSEA